MVKTRVERVLAGPGAAHLHVIFEKPQVVRILVPRSQSWVSFSDIRVIGMPRP